MTNVTMQGSETALLSKVRESIRPINALMEFVDNSIDAGATKIDISYSNNRLSIKDNGKGMSKTSVQKWCKNITTHLSNNNNDIGIKGVGSKYAMMALANLDDYASSKVEYITYQKNSTPQHVVWVMEHNKKFDVSIYPCEINQSGTEIIINECVPLDENEIIFALSHHYSIISKKKKVAIKFNKKNIKFNDNCHLDLINKDINIDGNYIKDGVVFAIRTITAIDEKNNDEISLKMVAITITQNASDNCYKQARSNCRDGGIYTLFNDRYINYGDNTIDMIGKGGSDRGGRGNVRVLLFLNKENQHVFDINSDKNIGIKFLKDNRKLKNYKVVETNMNLYNYIVNMYDYAFKIISYETKNTHGDKTLRREITNNIVNAIFNGKNINIKNIKKNEKLPITIDTLDIILPNFENENPNLKDIIYSFFNSCKKVNLNDDKTLEIISHFWDYVQKRNKIQVC